MIKKIGLLNFKCFEDFSMELKNVNVFTGINGMGKSTVIQSLLLLAQSYYLDRENKGLILNPLFLWYKSPTSYNISTICFGSCCWWFII